jgi:hypothetical protein
MGVAAGPDNEAKMLRKIRLVVWGLASGLLFGSASPALAVSGCTFKSAGGMNLTFSLDPSSPFDVIATATPFSLGANQWGSCTVSGVTMFMTVNPGGGLSMTNGSAVIPYTLTLPATVTPGPTGGANYVGYTLTGKVLWTDFANAPAGAPYTSNVTIHVNP